MNYNQNIPKNDLIYVNKNISTVYSEINIKKFSFTTYLFEWQILIEKRISNSVESSTLIHSKISYEKWKCKTLEK